MGVATDSIMVRASAPGYVARTWISGGIISGNWEIGRVAMATAPTMTITIEITIATMGRLIKNLEIIGFLPALGSRPWVLPAFHRALSRCRRKPLLRLEPSPRR